MGRSGFESMMESEVTGKNLISILHFCIRIGNPIIQIIQKQSYFNRYLQMNIDIVII